MSQYTVLTVKYNQYAHKLFYYLTSTAGSDYAALSRDLTFNPGAGSNQCVNITIIDDTAIDNSVEFFTVVASSAGLTSRTVTIIISDSDRK